MFKYFYFRRSSIVLLVLVSIFFSVSLCSAQQLGTIPYVGNVNVNSLKVVPFVQLGYKFIGLNYNLPLNGCDAWAGRPNSVDLSLKDAAEWMGSIGFDSSLASKFLFSLRADGNATKNIRVFTGQDFQFFQSPDSPLPYDWSGSQLQWWDIDGIVGYSFIRDWAILLGLRYDKLTVGLSDPVDANGSPINMINAAFPGTSTSILGDVTVQAWVPYIGLQCNGANYKGQLLYSPFASSQILAPQSLYNFAPAVFQEFSGIKWNFTNTGSFFEAYLEYRDVSLHQAIQFGLWARGSWMSSRGSGNWSLKYGEMIGGTTDAGSQNATGSLSTYGISFGISTSFSMN